MKFTLFLCTLHPQPRGTSRRQKESIGPSVYTALPQSAAAAAGRGLFIIQLRRGVYFARERHRAARPCRSGNACTRGSGANLIFRRYAARRLASYRLDCMPGFCLWLQRILKTRVGVGIRKVVNDKRL